MPSPTGLVVKNGSKIRCRDLGRDAGPGVADLDARLVAVPRVRMVSVPRPPIACTALSMRLVHTWLSSAAYAGTGGSVRSKSLTTVMPCRSCRAASPACVFSRSCTSIRWCGARSIWEYCLAAPTRVEIRVDASVDLAHQLLGLERVGQPAHRALERLGGDRGRHASPGTSTSSAARDEDRRQRPSRRRRRAPPASRRARPRASEASIGESCRRASAAARPRSSCSVDQRLSSAVVDLCRRPASPACAASRRPARRSAAVARTAAAAGLFSSWVRPADSAPSASSRSRCRRSRCAVRMPRNRPSSRCIAIGNHCCISVAKSSRREHEEPRVGDRAHGRRVGLRSSASSR